MLLLYDSAPLLIYSTAMIGDDCLFLYNLARERQRRRVVQGARSNIHVMQTTSQPPLHIIQTPALLKAPPPPCPTTKSRVTQPSPPPNSHPQSSTNSSLTSKFSSISLQSAPQSTQILPKGTINTALPVNG